MNSKDRELLLRAREILANKRKAYICYALKLAESESGFCAGYLLEYVTSALHPHTTLEAWQWTWANPALQRRDSEQLLKDRLAWIDWMLGELE